MHEYIDQLLANGQYDEAIPLIEKIWEKEAQAEKEIIAKINSMLNALEEDVEINK